MRRSNNTKQETGGFVPGTFSIAAYDADAEEFGVACYTESTGGGFESGVVRVHPDGSVTVTAGTHDHGQGHGTTGPSIVIYWI